MPVDVNQWMNVFTKEIKCVFKEKLEFVGLQGSYGRGEATENSDIDVAVILRELTMSDLESYKTLISQMPCREKICGFISGKSEMLNWERSDLFQFYYDTTPFFGSIDYLSSLITASDVKRASLLGACNIYHMCCHNFLHENDMQILLSLYKSAFFVLRAKHFYETGIYIKRKADLKLCLCREEKELLEPCKDADFNALSEYMIAWSGKVIRSLGNS